MKGLGEIHLAPWPAEAPRTGTRLGDHGGEGEAGADSRRVQGLLSAPSLTSTSCAARNASSPAGIPQ